MKALNNNVPAFNKIPAGLMPGAESVEGMQGSATFCSKQHLR